MNENSLNALVLSTADQLNIDDLLGDAFTARSIHVQDD